MKTNSSAGQFFLGLVCLYMTIMFAGCQSTRKIYLSTYKNTSKPSLPYDYQYKKLSDTPFVKINYNSAEGAEVAATPKFNPGLSNGTYTIFVDDSLYSQAQYRDHKLEGKKITHLGPHYWSSAMYKGGVLNGISEFGEPNGKNIKIYYENGKPIYSSVHYPKEDKLVNTLFIGKKTVRTETINLTSKTMKVEDAGPTGSSENTVNPDRNAELKYNEGTFKVRYKDFAIVDCSFVSSVNTK